MGPDSTSAEPLVLVSGSALANYPIAHAADVDALARRGITTDHQLLQHVARRGDAGSRAVEPQRMRQLIAAASLATIDGIGPRWASLLVATDVWTPRQLAAHSPETLTERMRRAADVVGLGVRVPSVGQVRTMVWLARAATAPKIHTPGAFRQSVRTLVARERRSSGIATLALIAVVVGVVAMARFAFIGVPERLCEGVTRASLADIGRIGETYHCVVVAAAAEVSATLLPVMGWWVAVALVTLSWPLSWIQEWVRGLVIRDLDAELLFSRIEGQAHAMRRRGVWLVAVLYVIAGLATGGRRVLEAAGDLAPVVPWIPAFIVGLVGIVSLPWVVSVAVQRRRLAVPWDVAETVFRCNIINSSLPVGVLVLFLTTIVPGTLTWVQTWSVEPVTREAVSVLASYDRVMAREAAASDAEVRRFILGEHQEASKQARERLDALRTLIPAIERDVLPQLRTQVSGWIILTLGALSFFLLLSVNPLAFAIWVAVAIVGDRIGMDTLPTYVARAISRPSDHWLTLLAAVGALMMVNSVLDTLKRK